MSSACLISEFQLIYSISCRPAFALGVHFDAAFVKCRGTQLRNSGASKLTGATSDDSAVDQRLKNFEPRMLELITSEVSPLCHFLFLKLELDVQVQNLSDLQVV